MALAYWQANPSPRTPKSKMAIPNLATCCSRNWAGGMNSATKKNKALKVKTGKLISPVVFNGLPSNTAAPPSEMLKPAVLYGNFQTPFPFIENPFIPTAVIWLSASRLMMIENHSIVYRRAMHPSRKLILAKTIHSP